jgi:predicted RNase H-like HicB family nuclease
MSDYRIIVTRLTERDAFLARAPELENCAAEGTTRAEALANLEHELAAQLENMSHSGVTPPRPVDLEEFDGQLQLSVSPDLHRDLFFRARELRTEFEAYLKELVARGAERDMPGRQDGARQRSNDSQRGGRRREGQGGGRYHDIMENRADFIEYVRGLDRGGGNGGSGGGRGGRRGGRP